MADQDGWQFVAIGVVEVMVPTPNESAAAKHTGVRAQRKSMKTFLIKRSMRPNLRQMTRVIGGIQAQACDEMLVTSLVMK
ncbi:MAG: hypothetical protein RIC14_05510 [Filomicrobium sp.]